MDNGSTTGGWEPLKDDFWKEILKDAARANLTPRIVVWKGKECTCGYGGRLSPELHRAECLWRQMAENDRAEQEAKTTSEEIGP